MLRLSVPRTCDKMGANGVFYLFSMCFYQSVAILIEYNLITINPTLGCLYAHHQQDSPTAHTRGLSG